MGERKAPHPPVGRAFARSRCQPSTGDGASPSNQSSLGCWWHRRQRAGRSPPPLSASSSLGGQSRSRRPIWCADGGCRDRESRLSLPSSTEASPSLERSVRSSLPMARSGSRFSSRCRSPSTRCVPTPTARTGRCFRSSRDRSLWVRRSRRSPSGVGGTSLPHSACGWSSLRAMSPRSFSCGVRSGGYTTGRPGHRRSTRCRRRRLVQCSLLRSSTSSRGSLWPRSDSSG